MGEKKANIVQVPHDEVFDSFASDSFIDNLLVGDSRSPPMDHQVA